MFGQTCDAQTYEMYLDEIRRLAAELEALKDQQVTGAEYDRRKSEILRAMKDTAERAAKCRLPTKPDDLIRQVTGKDPDQL